MANEAYVKEGTTLLVSGASGANVAWSMENKSSGTGQVSAQIDLGTSPRPAWYMWSCRLRFQTSPAPTQGLGVALYKAGAPSSDATMVDGDIGQADAALADVDMRRNLAQFGYVVSENAVGNEPCTASGMFYHAHRYLSLVGYNESGTATDATDTVFEFYLTPISWQGQ